MDSDFAHFFVDFFCVFFWGAGSGGFGTGRRRLQLQRQGVAAQPADGRGAAPPLLRLRRPTGALLCLFSLFFLFVCLTFLALASHLFAIFLRVRIGGSFFLSRGSRRIHVEPMVDFV